MSKRPQSFEELTGEKRIRIKLADFFACMEKHTGAGPSLIGQALGVTKQCVHIRSKHPEGYLTKQQLEKLSEIWSPRKEFWAMVQRFCLAKPRRSLK